MNTSQERHCNIGCQGLSNLIAAAQLLQGVGRIVTSINISSGEGWKGDCHSIWWSI